MPVNDTAYGLSGKSSSDPVTAKLWEQRGKWKPDIYLALLLSILLPLMPPEVTLLQPCQPTSDRDCVCLDGIFLMCNMETLIGDKLALKKCFKSFI